MVPQPNKRDENLLVVAAVSGYSLSHGLSASETLSLFDRFNVLSVIRDNYETLHTQSLEESASFAQDYLARMGA